MTELCREFELHPNQITEWKKQLLERAADIFGAGTEAADPVDLVPLHAKLGHPGEGVGDAWNISSKPICWQRQ